MVTAGQFDAADVRRLVAGAADFCRHELDPLRARPHEPPSTDEIAVVTEAAEKAGLVAPGPDAPLWGQTDSPHHLAASLGILSVLASASSGAAFHLHQLALAGLLARRLDADVPPRTLPVLEVGGGLARRSLARLLAGGSIGDEDAVLLADCLPGPSREPVIVQAADAWEALLVPRFEPVARALRWEVVSRGQVNAVSLGGGHGLDGTLLWAVRLADGGTPVRTAGSVAHEMLVAALGCNALGLLAIALGSLRDGWERAWRHAGERVQAGRPIRDHPAVQLLLADARSTIILVESVLDAAAPPSSFPDLLAAFALRVRLHPVLCSAATSLLQVLGGYGYMRDYGLERCLRDNQHLRLGFGGPTDLALLLMAGEEATK